MRRLAWLIVILVVVWCAWWTVASTGLQQSLDAWFEDRRNMGWQAEVADISKHGFPLTLHARLHEISIADPTTGIGVDTPQLDLLAAAYWPGFMTVKLPNAPIDIVTPAGHFTLKTDDAQADLRLHPGTTLQLQSMSAVSDIWQINSRHGSVLSADDLHIAAMQDDASAETYQFDVNATNLTPGTHTRAIFSLPADWPAEFEAFFADFSVRFDRPWDHTALIQKRPQPRAISLREIRATWGALGILATGDLTIDSSGIPTGTLSLAITNWREILKLAEASGAVPDAQRLQVEIILGALSNLGGGQNDIDLTLTLKDGQMSLGPIPLGPAPHLILR